jgi:uncharacterized membrane protein
MPKQSASFDKFRIEAFSDTVVAIVLVAMSLHLRIPDSLTADTTAEFARQITAYAMSFLVLGIMWVNHRQLAATLDSAPRGYQWLNLNVLFWMTLIPLTTAHVADRTSDPTALALYSGLFAIASLSLTLLRYVLSRQRPDNPDLALVNFAMSYRSLAAGLIYAAGAPLAFITPYAAWACLILVPLMFFVPLGPAKDRP